MPLSSFACFLFPPPPSQHLTLFKLPSSGWSPYSQYYHPNSTTTCQGPLHKVPFSWAGSRSHSKLVGLQQTQQLWTPTSVAAEWYPGTGIHDLLFLGRRTKTLRTPIEALPRLHGHRTPRKRLGPQTF